MSGNKSAHLDLKRAALAALVGTVFICGIDWLKDVIFAGQQGWWSHLLTGAIGGVSSAALAVLTWVHDRGTHEALLAENADRQRAEEAAKQLAAELKAKIVELKERTTQLDLFANLSDALQICITKEEVMAVLKEFLLQIMPLGSGAVYCLNDSRTLAECVLEWGEDARFPATSPPDACCALRSGRSYVVEPRSGKLACAHWHHDPERFHLCVPMQAHGEVMGFVSLRSPRPTAEMPINDAADRERLARTAIGRAALLLADLRLREVLRTQAVRDPLTNLHNRRFLEESLDRELKRSDRTDSTLAALMLDLDHFKDFNDAHGHQAGDHLLCQLGGLLRERFRSHDICCRYGGEEFAVIMPDIAFPAASARAEELRNAIANMVVAFRGQTVRNITASIGMAMYPANGTTAEALIASADRALYRAKREGRNRVVIAPASALAASVAAGLAL